MSDPVLDNVTTTGASVVANSTGVAVSMFYQAAGHAYALTMQNAAANQQNVNALNNPIIANAVKLINGPAAGVK